MKILTKSEAMQLVSYPQGGLEVFAEEQEVQAEIEWEEFASIWSQIKGGKWQSQGGRVVTNETYQRMQANDTQDTAKAKSKLKTNQELIAKSFPNAKKIGLANQDEYEISVGENRRLHIISKPDAIQIDFFNRKGKTTASAADLQTGTLDFVKGLSAFVDVLSQKGIPIDYGIPSDQRREAIYAKVISNAGYVPAESQPSEKIIRWEPKGNLSQEQIDKRFEEHKQRINSLKLPKKYSEFSEDHTAARGKDGERAEELLSRAKDNGGKTLYYLSMRAIRRLVESPNYSKAKHFFDADELIRFADCLAGINSAANLLGRSRIREKAEQVESKAKGVKEFSEEESFVAFKDEPVIAITPSEAISQFQKKVPGLSVTPTFAPMMRRNAFTLAVSTDETLLQKVKDIIEQGKQGDIFNPGQRIQEILEQAGVTPKNPSYGNMVFRTNIMREFNEGQTEEVSSPDMQEMFPYWQYLGIRDGRQGQDHEPHFDKYYPSSVSFDEVRGERIFNCLLPGNRVSGDIIGGLKAHYSGKVIHLQTLHGARLSVTGNHPIMTDQGWILANDIREGDNLLCDYRPVNRASYVDDQDRPFLVEDIFNSLRIISVDSMVAKVSPIDLHGDGAFCQGKINIVRADGKLLRKQDFSLLQNIGKNLFGRSDVHSQFVPALSTQAFAFKGIPLSSSGLMSSNNLVSSFFGGHSRPFDGFGFGLVSGLNTSEKQSSPYGTSASAEELRELIFRFPRQVQFDKVSKVSHAEYSGPVYDCETSVGYYSASQSYPYIFVSNCRCSRKFIDKYSWAEMMKQGIRLGE